MYSERIPSFSEAQLIHLAIIIIIVEIVCLFAGIPFPFRGRALPFDFEANHVRWHPDILQMCNWQNASPHRLAKIFAKSGAHRHCIGY